VITGDFAIFQVDFILWRENNYSFMRLNIHYFEYSAADIEYFSNF